MALIPSYCPHCSEQLKPVTENGIDQFWCAYHGLIVTGVDEDGKRHAVD